MLDAISSMRPQDIIDILLVSYIIYRIMLLLRGTRAVQMVAGIAVIIIIYFLSGKLELQTLHWLFKTFLSSILLVIVILFQADIRRALTQMGRTPFHKVDDVAAADLDEVIRAATFMARRRIGALIVLERGTGLREYIDTGHRLDARLRAELLVAIFQPTSPHADGGVIIPPGPHPSSGCLLPLLPRNTASQALGTPPPGRARAFRGERRGGHRRIRETQEISVVRQGTITPFHDEEEGRAARSPPSACRGRRPRAGEPCSTPCVPDHARKA